MHKKWVHGWNPKVRFPKYEFNNKLSGSLTLLRVTLGVTWI